LSRGPGIRAVLFDATGTLIELREPVGATYARFAARFGADVPASRLDEAFSRVLVSQPPRVFPGTDPTRAAAHEREWWRRVVDDTFRTADGAVLPSPAEACFAALWEHFSGSDGWQLRPAAAEVLRALRARGLRTGVISNFDHRLHSVLEALEINEFLDIVVIPAEIGAAKPDRQIFQAAIDRVGLSGSEIVYVGDRADTDEAGAERAGLRPIGVSSLATLADLPRVLGLDSGDTTAPR